ncbi:MAG: LysR family transcriptional regulator [Limnohabitans sp.]|jgi:DNA-binding transcriptional LysR family regulator|nr:LysR family transcriptional regulator [Limnohabitans sp.]
MHVTFRHIRAAVSVSEHGSFRAAAEAIHLSQPALSLAVSELEQLLGVTLFDRTSRSVTMTEVGQGFLQGASRLMEDFERLVHETGDIAQSKRGRVVVTCVSSIAGRVMPLALQRCTELFPKVEVTVRDDVASQVIAAVRSREADFAVTVQPLEVGDGMLFEPLSEDRFHLVCHRDHGLARRRTVAWHDLHGQSLISLSTSSGTHHMVHDELVRQRIEPARTTAVSHLSTVHGMLEAGFGVAVLPQLGLPVQGHPTLVVRPLVRPTMSRVVGVYRRLDRSLSPAASALLDVIRWVLDDARRERKRRV